MPNNDKPFDVSLLMEQLYGTKNPIERMKEIFSMNYGPGTKVITGLTKECAEVFIETLRALESRQTHELKSNFLNEKICTKKIYEANKVDIELLKKGLDIDGYSYEEIIDCCYDSIKHENLILFYAMLEIMLIKIRKFVRLSDSDYICISKTLLKMKHLITNDYNQHYINNNSAKNLDSSNEVYKSNSSNLTESKFSQNNDRNTVTNSDDVNQIGKHEEKASLKVYLAIVALLFFILLVIVEIN